LLRRHQPVQPRHATARINSEVLDTPGADRGDGDNFVVLAGDQGLLGQTAGRTSKAVTAWLDALGQQWKDTVLIVAMDPCASYRAAVLEALPNALIVADHFHLVRLANQADRCPPPGHLGHPRPSWPQDRPGVGGPLSKGELRALLATARTGGQRHDVAHRLHRCNSWCASSGLPELERLASTIEAWWPEVLGFCRPASRTPAPNPPTGPSRRRRAPPTASATSTTNDAGYGSPAPGNNAGPPPAEGCHFPLEFEEPPYPGVRRDRLHVADQCGRHRGGGRGKKTAAADRPKAMA